MDSSVPEWVLYLGAAFGSMVAAIVVRLGWKAGGDKKPHHQEKSLVLDGALVDSSSVMKLAIAIEAVNISLMEVKSQNSRASEARAAVVAKAADSIASLAASVERFNRHSEEAEERREEREREDLRRRNEQLERDLREAQRAKMEGGLR